MFRGSWRPEGALREELLDEPPEPRIGTATTDAAASHDEALAAFIVRKREIDAMLGRLTTLSADHFAISEGNVDSEYVDIEYERLSREFVGKSGSWWSTTTPDAAHGSPGRLSCVCFGGGLSPQPWQGMLTQVR